MLAVENLAAAYGASPALSGVSLQVAAGQVVTLLGRNGMGKTTTVRAIMGMLPALGGRITAGRVVLDGAPTAGWPSSVPEIRSMGSVMSFRKPPS